MRQKKRWSVKERQKLHLFRSNKLRHSLRVALGFKTVFEVGRKKNHSSFLQLELNHVLFTTEHHIQQ